MLIATLNILAYDFPLRPEYLTWPKILLLFGVFALPILALGMRSLNGLGPMRKWVAIFIRLAVLALFVLIVAGVRWQRTNKNLEVMVLRDVSESTSQVPPPPNRKTLQEAEDEWFRWLGDDKNGKPNLDRMGVVG